MRTLPDQKRTIYMLNLNNFSNTRPILDPKLLLDWAQKELKLCLKKKRFFFNKYEVFHISMILFEIYLAITLENNLLLSNTKVILKLHHPHTVTPGLFSKIKHNKNLVKKLLSAVKRSRRFKIWL